VGKELQKKKRKGELKYTDEEPPEKEKKESDSADFRNKGRRTSLGRKRSFALGRIKKEKKVIVRGVGKSEGHGPGPFGETFQNRKKGGRCCLISITVQK